MRLIGRAESGFAVVILRIKKRPNECFAASNAAPQGASDIPGILKIFLSLSFHFTEYQNRVIDGAYAFGQSANIAGKFFL